MFEKRITLWSQMWSTRLYYMPYFLNKAVA